MARAVGKAGGRIPVAARAGRPLAGVPARVFPFLAAAILACFVTPPFVLRDLPYAAGIATLPGPLEWYWGGLALTAAHLAAFAIVLAGAGAGPRVLLGRAGFRGIDLALLTLAAGAGVTGTSVLGLGLCGLSGRVPVLAGCGVFAMLGLGEARRWAAAADRVAGQRKWRIAGWAPGWAAVTVAGAWIAWLGIPDLLAPEAFADALVYHLAVPRQWFASGRITAGEPFASQFPLLMSANYLVALATQGERLARAVNVLCGIGLVAAAARIARGWLDPGCTRWGAALAGTSPILALIAFHAGADTAVALFTVLSLLAAARARPGWPAGPVRPAALGWAGAMAGLAAAAKPQGLAVPVLLGVLLAAGAGGIRRAGFRFVLAATAGWLPWAAKAWLLTANPVFPFLDGVFPSPCWTDFSRSAYADELASVRNQFTAADVGLPWAPGGFVSRFKLGLVGPVPLLAAILAVFVPWAPAARLPGMFVAALATGWALSVPAWRFLAAGFALMPFLLAGTTASRAGRMVAATAVAIQLAWIPIVLDVNDRPWNAARGRMDRTRYYQDVHLNSDLDAVEMQEKFGAPGPARRTIAVGDAWGYLMPQWAVWGGWFEPAPFMRLAAEAGGPERLFVRLRQRGIRFILVNPGEMIRLSIWTPLVWEGRRPVRTLRAFFTRHSTLVYARASGWVYSIGRRAAGARVPECLDGGLDPGYRVATICVEEARASLESGDPARALRCGWAAVAAAPHSGMAWAVLGDCFYGAGKWDEASNVYRTAATYGWTTSVLYRNCALADGKAGNWARARQAIAYALSIDPASRRIQEDIAAVDRRWNEAVGRDIDRLRRGGSPGAP